MTTISFGIQSYKLFFDRDNVIARLTRGERRALSGAGAFGRTAIRRNVRKAPKRKSKTRTSVMPRYHVDSNSGLRFVLFSYNAESKSVIIGPQKFGETVYNRTFKKGRIYQRNVKPVPQLLNEGGTATRRTFYKSGFQVKRQMRYRKFPFVDYAMAATVRKFQELVSDGLL